MRRRQRSPRDVAVWRQLQSKVFAQGLALIIAAEQVPALQFRNHQFDEIIEAPGQEWRHDVEAVASVLAKPLLHVVDNRRRRAADDGLGAGGGDPGRHLANGQVFAARHLGNLLKNALTRIRCRSATSIARQYKNPARTSARGGTTSAARLASVRLQIPQKRNVVRLARLWPRLQISVNVG